MAAGMSARVRSRELEDDADALFELSQLKRREAAQYAAASRHEESLAAKIRALDLLHWTVLEDRSWPGSRSANVDFILVGPGGVVVLDAKDWSELEIRDSTLYRGQADASDEIAKLDSLAHRLADDLSDLGLTHSAIHIAMIFSKHKIRERCGPVALLGETEISSWLAGLGHRLGDNARAQILRNLERSCPPASATSPRRSLRARLAPLKASQEQTLIDVDELAQSLLDAALVGPLEDWMTFLHPDQNRLVRSRWNGPARIRGSAGTGKTVVGLHRAVYLAHRSIRPVLYVSFIKTLPVVLASLARRLSPQAAEKIEFFGIHQLAADCLRIASQNPCRIDAAQIQSAFDTAWQATASAAQLRHLVDRPGYWKEEIDCVIKGRGISDFVVYESLQRVGRTTPLRSEDRRHMWQLYEAYEAELKRRRIDDFNDLLIRGRQAAERFPDLFQYGAVVVDEVQDLNLVGLQLLVAIAGEAPGSLLLIGDGQQSVYPGGFRLAEAGLNVAGRASVLSENYRNTVEILEEATRWATSDVFEDLGDSVERLEERASRHGHVPMTVFGRNHSDLDAAMTHQIAVTHERLKTPWGHFAVLAEGTRDVSHFKAALRAARIPYIDLLDYDGKTSDQVKVGTIKRAKGLEFPYVLLPRMRHHPPTRHSGESEDAHTERVERWRREIYVAMTRARDGLWLGYLPR